MIPKNIVNGLVQYVRASILAKYAGERTCMETSYVTSRILHCFGFKAEYVTCNVVWYDSVRMKWMNEHEPPTTLEEFELFPGCSGRCTGGRQGGTPDGEILPGHVVCIAEGTLFDLSFDQFKINGMSFASHLFFDGIKYPIKDLDCYTEHVNDYFVDYFLLPSSERYKVHRDGILREELDEIVDRILLKMSRTIRSKVA